MKILIAGNMVNCGYNTAKLLREKNIDVILLMNTNPHPISDPLKFDSSLNNKYPEWIHFYDTSSRWWVLKILREMWNKKYDIIQAHVELPMFCNLITRPYIAYCQGSDLRELAFAKTIKGYLLRSALKRANIVIYGSPDMNPLVKKLGLNSVFVPYTVGDIKIKKSHWNDKLIIFYPTSMNWRLKGNDIFIKAFAKFTKNNDAKLIMTKRGDDNEKTIKLIDDLEISSHITFTNTLNKKSMQHFYDSCDVVADQFVVDSMGAICMETLMNGKPLITSINNDEYKEVYNTLPPILNAKSEEEICQKLELIADKKTRQSIGNDGKEWYKKYHSTEPYITKLIKIYENILKNGAC